MSCTVNRSGGYYVSTLKRAVLKAPAFAAGSQIEFRSHSTASPISEHFCRKIM